MIKEISNPVITIACIHQQATWYDDVHIKVYHTLVQLTQDHIIYDLVRSLLAMKRQPVEVTITPEKKNSSSGNDILSLNSLPPQGKATMYQENMAISKST